MLRVVYNSTQYDAYAIYPAGGGSAQVVGYQLLYYYPDGSPYVVPANSVTVIGGSGGGGGGGGTGGSAGVSSFNNRSGLVTAQTGDYSASQITGFDEAAQDAAAAMITGGSGINVSYNDASNLLTITSTGGGSVTDEAIDDRVAALLQAGSGITLTYDDAGNALTIASTGGGSVTDEAIDDRVAALLQAGKGISLTYDDTANTLTIATPTYIQSATPSSPVNGDTWLDLSGDTPAFWEYQTGYWLSPQEKVDIAAWNQTVARYEMFHPPANTIWKCSIDLSMIVAGVNNASNYWKADIVKFATTGGTVSVIASLNTSGQALSVWNKQSLAIGPVQDLSAIGCLALRTYIGAGSPGTYSY